MLAVHLEDGAVALRQMHHTEPIFGEQGERAG
jgi:hypothetical protein